MLRIDIATVLQASEMIWETQVALAVLSSAVLMICHSKTSGSYLLKDLQVMYEDIGTYLPEQD